MLTRRTYEWFRSLHNGWEPHLQFARLTTLTLWLLQNLDEARLVQYYPGLFQEVPE